MNRYFFLFLLILSIIFINVHAVFAAEATGTLYYLEESEGEGLVHIYAKKNLLRLHYMQEELKQSGFHGQSATYYGAIWTISYHKDDTGLVLDKATFTGNFDESVNRATTLVRNHYYDLYHKDYSSAYNNLSPAWQKSQSYNSFVKGFKNVTFSENSASTPSNALKIIGQNSKLVLVLVDMSWFTGEDSYLEYEVVKINNSWYIDRVKKIDGDDWLES
jgi:hypothetical protein